MEYKKWFYKGLTLREYCRNNSINYSSIVGEVRRLSKKYPDKKREELIEFTIENYGKDHVKFKYKGKSLYDYCRKNNLNYTSVRERVNRYLNNNPKNLENDEIVEYILKTYVKDKCMRKYYYDGMTLHKYCQKNNLKYTTMMKRISYIKECNPEMSDKEVVESAINFVNTKNVVMYNGKSLYSYCLEKGINYSKIKSRYENLKAKKEYENLSDNELIRKAFITPEVVLKYVYKGQAISVTCKELGVSYNKIIGRIKALENKKEYADYSLEEIVNLVMENAMVNYKNIKNYTYKGKDLKEYCKEHNLDYKYYKRNLEKLLKDEKFQGISEEELIEKLFNNEVNTRSIYRYQGMTLSVYCRKNRIKYSAVITFVNSLKNKDEYKDLGRQEILEIAINKVVDRQNNCSYKYQGISLKEYCKNNCIEYGTIVGRIERYKKIYRTLSIDKIIEKSLKNRVLPSKYRYKGMDLKEYCASNGLVYYDIMAKYRKLKKENSDSNLTEENLIDMVINKQRNENSSNNDEYLYKNESLRKYCKDNNMDYNILLKRLKRLESKKGYEVYSRDQLIGFILDDNRPSIYHYKGLPFNIYCKENDLDYDAILQRIYFIKRNKNHSNLNDVELIDMALNENYGKSNKLYYNGIPLKEYCQENGLKECTIKSRIKALKKNIKFKDCNIDILVDLAINKKGRKNSKSNR